MQALKGAPQNWHIFYLCFHKLHTKLHNHYMASIALTSICWIMINYILSNMRCMMPLGLTHIYIYMLNYILRYVGSNRYHTDIILYR